MCHCDDKHISAAWQKTGLVVGGWQGQESLCRANYQDQPDQGDGILPGGRGRTTIFVDTSTVRQLHLLFYRFTSSMPQLYARSNER